MKFCKKCGKQLEDGQICDCTASNATPKSTYTPPTASSRAASNRTYQQQAPTHQAPSQTYQAPQAPPPSPYGATHYTAAPSPPLTPPHSAPSKMSKSSFSAFIESMKNRMGIGEPERNATDCYERNLQIVPDCISPNENEIPVKQYNIAILRNLLRFERAEGRVQVTNKRVVFRAAGRSIGGRTTLQQEFAIDELAGIEAQRNFRFGFIYLLFGLIVVGIIMSLFSGIFSSINGYFVAMNYEANQQKVQSLREKQQAENDKAFDKYWDDREKIELRYADDEDRLQEELQKLEEEYQSSTEARNTKYQEDISKQQKKGTNGTSVFVGILRYLFGFAGLASFFLLRKKFLLKLLFLGVSYAAFLSYKTTFDIDDLLYRGAGGLFSNIFSGFNLFVIITIIIIIFGLALYSLKPNLVLLIKTKGGIDGAAPIKILSGRSFWAWRQNSGVGFSEVFPTDESERAIREINALINDIQKLGDHGVQKWKQ